MKFLEAQQRKAGRGAQENKMLPGSRTDQDGPGSRLVQAFTDPPKEPESKDPPEELFISKEVTAVAEELGVDLATVVGSGHNGKILVRDVKAAARARTT